MRKRWTEEEIKILKRYYARKGSHFVAERVGHSPDTVMNKAAELGIRFHRTRPWKSHEDRYIREKYHKKKIASIARSLKRTPRSVQHRAEYLKLTKPAADKWSAEDIAALHKLYTDRNYTLDLIAKILNRSKNSVLLKAVRMGLSRASHIHRWSKHDHNYLLKNAGEKSYRDIANHLGIKNYQVALYAKKIGIKIQDKGLSWSQEEKDFIRKNYYKMPAKEIARRLNRTLNAVKNTASRMGVSEDKREPWTSRQLDYLKNNYADKTIVEIAKALNRSKKSVHAKAVRLRLRKRKKRKSTAKSEIARKRKPSNKFSGND